MRKYLLLGLAMLGLASCEKDDVTNVYIEEGAIQILVDGNNIFDAEDTTKIGFNVVPVGNSSNSGKYSASSSKVTDVTTLPDYSHKLASTVTVTLEWVERGLFKDIAVSTSGTSTFELPKNSNFNYVGQTSNYDSVGVEGTLPFALNGSFATDGDEVQSNFSLQGSTKFALISVIGNGFINTIEDLANYNAPLLEDDNWTGDADNDTAGQVLYGYVNAQANPAETMLSLEFIGTVPGTSDTVTGTVDSALFSVAAKNHYIYAIDVNFTQTPAGSLDNSRQLD